MFFGIVTAMAKTRFATATDADALLAWLKKHGYGTRPALKAWLERYIDQNWIITAFKLSKSQEDKSERGLATSAIRMSFKAKRPFYPYREPIDQMRPDAPPRVLKIFFIGDKRMDGQIGAAETPWPGTVRYAAHQTSFRTLLEGVLGQQSRPRVGWLTAFRDSSSPRPALDELYFVPSADQTTLKPAPINHVERREFFLPAELFVLIAGIFWFLRRRRKPGKKPA